MENKRGVFSHFGTIIRVIILIILVAVITFFVVRFFRNRNATQRAEQAASQTAQTEKENTDKSEESKKDTENKEQRNESSENQANNDQTEQQIPRGIAESEVDGGAAEVPAAGPEAIPEVGAGSSALVIAGSLGMITYAVTKSGSRIKKLRTQR